MNKSDINGLLKKYLAGNATSEEIAMLETWYIRYENKALSGITDQAKIDQLEKIRIKLASNSLSASRKRVWSWRKFAVAASILLVAGSGLWFYASRNTILNTSVNLSLSQGNDIAPGSNKAILTLANGKEITLSEAKTGIVIDATKLTYNDGTEVKDSAINHRHPELVSGSRTITTPRGGTYQVILSDGTHVWLNAASTLKFPSKFTGKDRKVELTGEAYFVVKHNPKQPFKIETKGQIVEDIGTEFNVNAYTNENSTKTTLIEGSVRITYTSRHPELNTEFSSESGSRTDNQNIILKPGQQSLLTSNGNIEVITTDTEETIAWKKGYFSFNDESIQSIMRSLSRWYNIEVSYQGNATKDGFNGKISRFKNISQVLKMLEDTKLVHFKVEGRRVTVMK